jgi:undecaprenyl-diphosphatase
MEQRTQDIVRIVSLRVLFALISFLVALYLFALLTEEIFSDGDHGIDQQVFSFLSQYSTDGLIQVMRVITFFGKHQFLIPAYLLLIGGFLLLGKKKYAIETAVMGTSSTALLFGLKHIFERQRPDLPFVQHLSGYSYPSGHALISFVFCSVLVYLVWNSRVKPGVKWTLAALLIIFSLAIGISRIVLRAHYFTDVLAGFCLGYIWVMFGLWLQRRFLKIRHRDLG